MRHFVCFDQVFAPISELIDLARWIKFNPSFITWLVLIVLSGTESNGRINFNPGLARFNPRLALIGFPGTGAWNPRHCGLKVNKKLTLILL